MADVTECLVMCRRCLGRGFVMVSVGREMSWIESDVVTVLTTLDSEQCYTCAGSGEVPRGSSIEVQ